MKGFEDGIIDLIKNVEFEFKTNQFQENLKKDQERIKTEPQVLVSADKTTNFYKLDPREYNELLEKNIQKDYKKEKNESVKKINDSHKKIVRNLEIDDRVFKTTEREAFITLKDHKENFKNNPSCRLINPCKPEVGKVSKQILERVISEVKSKTGFNQWKNTHSVIKWFQNIKNKKNQSFINFDVVNFYPSITKELLKKALDWASTIAEISDDEKDIILEAKKSILFNDGSPWSKKSDSDFDVGMGSFDGAESCDIIGLFMLSELVKLRLNINVGLYRDDGLCVSNSSPRQIENFKKKICEAFRKHGLSITIEANKKIINFLDIEMDLMEDTFKPFIKPNDTPLYVHKLSNHPPCVTSNIPAAVNRRLSALSSSQKMFESVAPTYQEALEKSGYDLRLEYTPISENPNKANRSRKRQILWFNPPFSTMVKTNIGAKFLKLVDHHFPADEPLRKIFNRNSIKVSYRCTPNLANIISGHNAQILKKKEIPNERKCSCPKGATCPLSGQCLQTNLVYQATVTQVGGPDENYIGLSAPTFKSRLGNHKKSFKHEKYEKETKLSKHIWSLKRKNEDYTIKWKLISIAKPFNPVTGVCNLCTVEKFNIIFKPELGSLNKREEIKSHCRHKAGLLLDKT